jgi:hypothetical protein
MLLDVSAISRDISPPEKGKRVRFVLTVPKPPQGKVAILASPKPRDAR